MCEFNGCCVACWEFQHCTKLTGDLAPAGTALQAGSWCMCGLQKCSAGAAAVSLGSGTLGLPLQASAAADAPETSCPDKSIRNRMVALRCGDPTARFRSAAAAEAVAAMLLPMVARSTRGWIAGDSAACRGSGPALRLRRQAAALAWAVGERPDSRRIRSCRPSALLQMTS